MYGAVVNLMGPCFKIFYKAGCLGWRLVEKRVSSLITPPLALGLSLTLHLTEGCSPNSIPLYIATQSLSADGETGIGIGSTFYGFD